MHKTYSYGSEVKGSRPFTSRSIGSNDYDCESKMRETATTASILSWNISHCSSNSMDWNCWFDINDGTKRSTHSWVIYAFILSCLLTSLNIIFVSQSYRRFICCHLIPGRLRLRTVSFKRYEESQMKWKIVISQRVRSALFMGDVAYANSMQMFIPSALGNAQIHHNKMYLLPSSARYG